MSEVDLGNAMCGDRHPVYVCAELGLNHNGSVITAEKLIDAAAVAGAQAVKLQRRTVDACYTLEQLAAPRESPWGSTYGEYKRAVELPRQAYVDLARYAQAKGLVLTASAWDEQALADLIEWVDPPWLKIASAVLTWAPEIRNPLLRAHARAGKPLVMSTGMCGYDEINEALVVMSDAGRDVLHGLVLLACTSTYPCDDADINLRTIPEMRDQYGRPIGYSGHERGIATTVAAVALGACFVERHITLDRTSWGSDHAASLEPIGFAKMVRDIRAVEKALGSPEKRRLASEVPVVERLRRSQ